MFFTAFNFLVFLSSLGMLGCAINLFIQIKSANIFSMFFTIAGLTLLLTSLCSFQLRKAPGCLLCFLMIDLCIFAVTLIMSLVLLLNQSKVETWARNQYDEYKDKHPDDFKNIDEYVDFLPYVAAPAGGGLEELFRPLLARA